MTAVIEVPFYTTELELTSLLSWAMVGRQEPSLPPKIAYRFIAISNALPANRNSAHIAFAGSA